MSVNPTAKRRQPAIERRPVNPHLRISACTHSGEEKSPRADQALHLSAKTHRITPTYKTVLRLRQADMNEPLFPPGSFSIVSSAVHPRLGTWSGACSRCFGRILPVLLLLLLNFTQPISCGSAQAFYRNGKRPGCIRAGHAV